ncbi:hypothetical protein DEI29_000509 [Salmonella enterica subsp. enterica]|nr:hypothetical protein [Salmonella enterica subsp. enterica]ELF6076842.1 hypothetical protein [Salmonella enterica]
MFKRRKESANYRYWRDDEEIFIVSNYKTMTINEMAAYLNRSYPSVEQKLRCLGLVKLHSLSSSDIAYIKCNLGKMSCSKIARHLGFSCSCITNFCKRNGLCFKVFGDNHHNTIHSDADFILINALYEEGVLVSEISSKFEIPFHTVSSYLFKKKRHVASDYYLYID